MEDESWNPLGIENSYLVDSSGYPSIYQETIKRLKSALSRLKSLSSSAEINDYRKQFPTALNKFINEFESNKYLQAVLLLESNTFLASYYLYDSRDSEDMRFLLELDTLADEVEKDAQKLVKKYGFNLNDTIEALTKLYEDREERYIPITRKNDANFIIYGDDEIIETSEKNLIYLSTPLAVFTLQNTGSKKIYNYQDIVRTWIFNSTSILIRALVGIDKVSSEEISNIICGSVSSVNITRSAHLKSTKTDLELSSLITYMHQFYTWYFKDKNEYINLVETILFELHPSKTCSLAIDLTFSEDHPFKLKTKSKN